MVQLFLLDSMYFAFVSLYLLASAFATTTRPTVPSEDDFYIPPQGYEEYEVGAILKHRNTPGPLGSIINKVSVESSWQLMVRSEDTFGNPSAVVATVIKPFNASDDKVLSYQSFQDSGNLDCAISFAIQYKSGFANLLGQLEMYLVSAFLSQGYYVLIPDHEGLQSAFTAGRNSGQATLNSIRAVLSSEDITGIRSDAKTVMWGFSGGSIAAGWAAVLQKEYAPELSQSLLGAALGGFYPNLTALFEYTERSLFSGLIPNAFAGIGNEYPEVEAFLDSRVSPDHAEQFSTRGDLCFFESAVTNVFRNYFTGPDRVFPDGWGIFNEEPLKTVLQENGLLYLSEEYVPQIPIFIFHGTHDNILPFRDAIMTFQRWCEFGLESGEFAEDQTSLHVTQAIAGAPAALTWVINRFNGVPPVQGCKHTARISNLLYPGAVKSILEYFSAIFDLLAGSDLGPYGLEPALETFSLSDVFVCLETTTTLPLDPASSIDEDFVHVYNRKMNSSGTSSKIFTSGVEGSINQVEESFPMTNLDGYQHNTNHSSLDKALQIDRFFTSSGTIKRAETYNHEVEMGSLSYKYLVHQKKQHKSSQKRRIHESLTQTKGSDDNLVHDISTNDKETDSRKESYTYEDLVSEDSIDDYYFPDLRLLDDNSSSEEVDLAITSFPKKNVDREIGEYNANTIESLELKACLGTDIAASANLAKSLQHDSTHNACQNTPLQNQVLARASTSTPVRHLSSDTPAAYPAKARWKSIEIMKGAISQTRLPNLRVQIIQEVDNMALSREELKKEVDDVAKEAYHWAKEAFNFPKVKDYVASIENM
ncbi:hypothetical protein KGF57_004415 [Candida theae]|uniref:Triacylglycerol lipase n=1 Tax=Candida theae TaxID=1198502 RepID=A0AAD5BB88_9ASCO|nr:uncharacterized protein KGF57_004415 [Candida theae]KAI5950070.1 hypothetical protein KGF57_004415 [Candida theae]